MSDHLWIRDGERIVCTECELDLEDERREQPMTSKSKIVPIAHAGVDSKGYHLECPRCDFRAYGRSDSTDEDAITKGSTREYVDHFIATHVNETN